MDQYSSGGQNFTTNGGQGDNNYDPQNYCCYGNYDHQPSNHQGYFPRPTKDQETAENSRHWMEYVSKMKEAQRAKLIEQLNSLPETGITLPPPSASSNRKAAQRPGYIKRPLNAFMIFSKVHRCFCIFL